MSETDQDAPQRDFWGPPVEPLRSRRGRPNWKKDKQNQEFAASRRAAGWSQDRIAAEMGIDPKTLRKNFSRELRLGGVGGRGRDPTLS